MKKRLFLLWIGLFLSGCTTSPDIPPHDSGHLATPSVTLEETAEATIPPTLSPTPTMQPTLPPVAQPRIILFIGDGMGSHHRTAGQYYTVGENRQLTMDQLSVRGWLETDTLSDEMTESAATATAMATGQKTYNGLVSIDGDGNALKTILEYAHEMGMSTGLVSTKFITDATTAAFGAHVENYAYGTETASQFLANRVDVLFGGGENDFLPTGVTGCHPENGVRTDGRNLVDEAIEAGYTFICDTRGFKNLDPATNRQVLGLFADENMERPYAPSLAEMTETAIQILSQNPKGYFLVVEGAQIDTASHYHETEHVLEDIAGLDEAVQVGMTYAQEDENMLLIVTADHETGGLRVTLEPNDYTNEKSQFFMPNGTEYYIQWTTSAHTDANVPVTAFGPGAERFAGLHPNTIVFDVMYQIMGAPAAGD